MPDEAKNLGQAALDLASSGFAVFPCKPRGKEPLTLHGFKDATRDEAQIRRWGTRWPNANIGLPTGEENGVVVIDVDGDKGETRLALLEGKFGKLPTSSKSSSGKGRHLWYALPDGYGPVPCGVADGLDLRGDGGYVIAPPSVHPNGKTYEWDERSPQEFGQAPEWLLRLAKNWKAEIEALEEAGEGGPEPRQGKASGNRAAFPNIHAPAPEPWSQTGEARLRSALAAIPAEN